MSGVACEHGNPWDECRVCQIQAAEERGRRRGVEEVRGLLERVLLVLAKVEAGEEDSWTSTVAHAVAIEVRKALAPRDSAPVCDNCKRAAAAKDGRTEHGIEIGPCYCDKLRAPRDSGKVVDRRVTEGDIEDRK